MNTNINIGLNARQGKMIHILRSNSAETTSAKVVLVGLVSQCLGGDWDAVMAAQGNAGWPCPLIRAAARAGGAL